MKFIKKVIDYLRNVILKLKNKLKKDEYDIQCNTNSKNISTERELSDEKLNKRKEEFENINIRDIIWANRYTTQEEKENIPVGHRKGPFLVVDKQDDKLYCLYGTSVEPTLENKKFFYRTNILNEKKITYFNISFIHIIDFDRYISRINELGNDESRQVFSLLKKLPCLKKYKGDKISIDFQIEAGDIINNINNYLVLDKKGDKLYCLLLDKSIFYLKDTFKLNDFDDLEYSKVVEITNKNIRYINSVDNNILIYILKKQKEHLENLKVPSRGCVIIKDSKKYYIYGEDGLDLLVFQIWKKNKGEDIAININRKTFYTDFNVQEKINKKDKMEIQLLATEDEIIKIREQKRSYFKSKKYYSKPEIKKVVNESIFQSGMIVKLDKNSFIDYMVISYDRQRDLVCCICLNELNVRPLRHYYFKSSSIGWIEPYNKQKVEKNNSKLKKILKN